MIGGNGNERPSLNIGADVGADDNVADDMGLPVRIDVGESSDAVTVFANVRPKCERGR
jgi:hypothetical protein